MINTNGQGKFLGINVNNYCFAANEQTSNGQQGNPLPQSELQSRQLHQLLQMQNNNSAEQLHRQQLGVAPLAKHFLNVVKTEPD